jgi:hypothetical protein
MWNDFHGHNQSFWGRIGEKMKREENFALVPASFRERKNWWSGKPPRTLEQIEEAERAAAERKRLIEEQRAAEVAAEEAAFQLKRQQAEAESASIRPRKGSNQ